ncbi:hypothetical protein VP1G_10705 [Cytospora mali]|uniref:Uncharacterized protein n=1 Tax=Cytospora mali TaxID=578113 RepID=A0A194UTJ7_CYTMA|nr:hypothetical protein VP1G_10705 [Valsa mali var. pyri (nom. inval.)]
MVIVADREMIDEVIVEVLEAGLILALTVVERVRQLLELFMLRLEGLVGLLDLGELLVTGCDVAAEVLDVGLLRNGKGLRCDVVLQVVDVNVGSVNVLVEARNLILKLDDKSRVFCLELIELGLFGCLMTLNLFSVLVLKGGNVLLRLLGPGFEALRQCANLPIAVLDSTLEVALLFLEFALCFLQVTDLGDVSALLLNQALNICLELSDVEEAVALPVEPVDLLFLLVYPLLQRTNASLQRLLNDLQARNLLDHEPLLVRDMAESPGKVGTPPLEVVLRLLQSDALGLGGLKGLGLLVEPTLQIRQHLALFNEGGPKFLMFLLGPLDLLLFLLELLALLLDLLLPLPVGLLDLFPLLVKTREFFLDGSLALLLRLLGLGPLLLELLQLSFVLRLPLQSGRLLLELHLLLELLLLPEEHVALLNLQLQLLDLSRFACSTGAAGVGVALGFTGSGAAETGTLDFSFSGSANLTERPCLWGTEAIEDGGLVSLEWPCSDLSCSILSRRASSIILLLRMSLWLSRDCRDLLTSKWMRGPLLRVPAVEELEPVEADAVLVVWCDEDDLTDDADDDDEEVLLPAERTDLWCPARRRIGARVVRCDKTGPR